ncbi:GGDEF domain-containing protein [Halomonas stenophila]|uniref:Diguanylate cyclase (GGDEF)-like protein n=1 Tax=Halomonas stenophila TaxID=795312 RepID=A0A7W5ESG0_9GAMM|nr:GGDEF domain-containing protein [Halomonas stenophila]MBB3230197.1 diguanylate cyclase (GGDEF)-like protein [Halomonas stenophila]
MRAIEVREDDTIGVTDAAWIGRLSGLQAVLSVMVAILAGTVLLGWGLAPFGRWLPSGWALMPASTAAACLLLALGQLGLARRIVAYRSARYLGGGIALGLAGLALVGHLGPRWGEGLLATDAVRMAWPVAVYLLLASLTLLLARPRGRAVVGLRDALLVAQLALVLTLVGARLFTAPGIVAPDAGPLLALHTLAGLAMLTLAQLAYQARAGLFSLLAMPGRAGRLLRRGWPLVVLLPFLVVVLASRLAPASLSPLAAALMVASLATLLLVTVLLMGGWNGRLEARLRELSLSDPLTGVYNRHAFAVLGEQLRRLARRECEPLSLLYFDLDGVKRVNDELGYEAGTRLIADFAGLLASHTRESDVVARLGGDEFVVLMRMHPKHLTGLLTRLEGERQALNARPGQSFVIDYSQGEAVIAPDDTAALSALLAQAESRMLARKARKRAWATAAEAAVTPASGHTPPRPAPD